MIDFATRCTQTKARAKAVPKIEAEGKGDNTKQPQSRNWASMSQHIARIANPAK